jgi:hypothetical protein
MIRTIQREEARKASPEHSAPMQMM